MLPKQINDMIIFWFLMLLLFVMTLLWRVRMVWSLALIQPTLKGQVTFLKFRRQCAWQWLFLKIRLQAKNASIYKCWRQDYCSLQDLTRAKICKYFFVCDTKTRVRIQRRVAMRFRDENKKFVKKYMIKLRPSHATLCCISHILRSASFVLVVIFLSPSNVDTQMMFCILFNWRELICKF